MNSTGDAGIGNDDQELADIYIGTAGYSYSHWRNGVFYPAKGVTQNQELRHFSGIFPAVEINASFHGVPRLETLQSWAAKAKKGFVFSLKVPQAITHDSRLENIQQALTFFLERIQEGLTTDNTNEEPPSSPSCLGPILFQLPPSLSKNVARLNEIAALIPAGMNNLKVAFEFRHKSWYNDEEVLTTLRRHNFGLCENISPDNSTLHSSQTTASTWHYIRFHKRAGQAVTNYTPQQLASVADQMVLRRRKNITQYCYFLNDHEGNGPRNAKLLMKLIKERSTDSTLSLVKNWKPDPVAPTIQSLFAKSAAAGTPQITSASPTAKTSQSFIKASQLLSSSAKRKETPSKTTPTTLHAFFSAPSSTDDTPLAKRQKSATNNLPTGGGRPQKKKEPKKGAITDFFSKKS